MQCPLGPYLTSDVPDYRVLQENSPSVESGRGRRASSYSAKPAIFLEYQKCLWLKDSTHEAAFHT